MRPQLNNLLRILAPFEFSHGGLLDVNRVFGDGEDDNGNNIADDRAESGYPPGWGPSPGPVVDGVWPTNVSNPAPGVGNIPSTNNDDPLAPTTAAQFNSYYNSYVSRRQAYARHLFCLMMLLTDRGYIHPLSPQTPAMSGVEQHRRTVARIAQWAVNVVDFRDSDSAMTAFEYDIDPFNGWSVDGNIMTDENQPTPGERRVVWGCEAPDLLITENTALHDKRVKDTDQDPMMRRRDPDPMNMMDDPNLDQYRIPQGSLFVELYCPRTKQVNNQRLPAGLYNGAGRLDLAFMHPVPSLDGARHPLWRIAISERHARTDATRSYRPNARFAVARDSTEFTQSLFVPATGEERVQVNSGRVTNVATDFEYLRLERFIWFNATNPAVTAPGASNPHPRPNQIFYNRFPNWDISLDPGRYMVIGPRTQTRIGNKVNQMQNQLQSLFIASLNRGNPTATGFRTTDMLGGNNPVVFPVPTAADTPNPGGMPLVGTRIRPVVGMVAGANAPSTWMDANNTAPQGIGINISEPMPNGGSYYREPTDRLAAGMPLDTYYDPTNPMPTLPDDPFDDGGAGTALENIVQTGTYDDVRTMFLQRLADPSLPWHPVINPYINVDWQAIDLSVYNGEDRQPAGYDPATNAWDPLDPNQTTRLNTELDLRTRGRGSFDRTNPQANLWPPVTRDPLSTVAEPSAPATEYYMPHKLQNSLGYINTGLSNNPRTLPAAYLGDPHQPFPIITWHDRPFANPYELMIVPSSTPSRLAFETPSNYTAPAVNQYHRQRIPPSNDDGFYGQFHFLMNFFHSRNTNTVPVPQPHVLPPAIPTTPAINDRKQAQYFRLFELVETPSPFVGTQKWYNPAAFTAGAGGATYRPPFNRMSRFRDPGRININTVSDERVWFALAKGFPSYDNRTFFRNVLRSRRGYAGNPFALNPNFPSLVANPFRAAFAADLMPDVGTPSMRLTDEVEATLLRSRPGTSVPPRNNNRQPLFVPPDSALQIRAPHRDNRRSPFMRYLGLSRLSNLVSNHSNVYAVWMTIGYFEVEAIPTGPDHAHPDGYMLGRELGIDDGTKVRHRAFYILDRSVPVGFQPNENNNVDRTILLRRLIE